MLVSRISPAPRSVASRAHSTTSRPVAVRPPATYASHVACWPRSAPAPEVARAPFVGAGRTCALASIASTTHCAPNTRASSSISSGSRERGRVHRDLVGARVQHRLRVLHRADAAADRERHEHLVGGAPRELDDRLAPLVGGGDVEEHQLVGPFAVVVGGQLHRVPGVADVEEFDALHDTAAVHVQAGDHALEVHALTVAVGRRVGWHAEPRHVHCARPRTANAAGAASGRPSSKSATPAPRAPRPP